MEEKIRELYSKIRERRIFMDNTFENFNQSKRDLKNVKKCAIFIHYSIDDSIKIEEKKK